MELSISISLHFLSHIRPGGCRIRIFLNKPIILQSVLDAKTRFLHVNWSYTLAPDNEKPGFFGRVRPGLTAKDIEVKSKSWAGGLAYPTTIVGDV